MMLLLVAVALNGISDALTGTAADVNEKYDDETTRTLMLLLS